MRRAITSGLVAGAFAFGLWTGHAKTWPFDPLWRGWRVVTGASMPFPYPDARPAGPGLDDGLIGVVDVVMLGDSITAMGRWNEYWPRLRVANRGIGGETAADMRKRLATVFAVDPQLVVLLVGTNDVAIRKDRERTIDDLEALVAILVPRVRTVLATVPPCVCSASQNDLVAGLNREIRRIAGKRGVALIDLHAALAKDGALDPALTTDGIHLNAAGYGRWVSLIAPHLPAPRRRS